MIQKKLIAGIGAAAILAFGGNAFAATSSANATATIQSQMAVTKVTGKDLRFGGFIAGTSGDTVVRIDPNQADAASRTIVSGDATPLGEAVYAFGPAEFTVSGTVGSGFTFSVDESSINITSSTNTMTVSDFTVSSSSGTIADGGSSVKVGGNLTISSGQADGSYSGIFNVTANYN